MKIGSKMDTSGFRDEIQFYGGDRVLGLREICVFGLGDGSSLQALLDYETEAGPIAEHIRIVQVLEPDDDAIKEWLPTVEGKYGFPIQIHTGPDAFRLRCGRRRRGRLRSLRRGAGVLAVGGRALYSRTARGPDGAGDERRRAPAAELLDAVARRSDAGDAPA